MDHDWRRIEEQVQRDIWTSLGHLARGNCKEDSGLSILERLVKSEEALTIELHDGVLG